MVTVESFFPVVNVPTENPAIKNGKRSGIHNCDGKDPPFCYSTYPQSCISNDTRPLCPFVCSMCKYTGTPVTWTTPFTTPSSTRTSLLASEKQNTRTHSTIPPSISTAQTACNDSPSANCSLYNATVICDLHGAYYLWARKHCPLFCGFCHVALCKDEPSANCALYNSTAICDVNGPYYTWARRNCEKSCGFCQDQNRHSTISLSIPTAQTDCRDTLNCKVYNSAKICSRDGIYYPWAQSNCPLYCGFCQAPTVTVACQDKLPNCDEYQSDLCINPLYRLWREDNCRKFCGICKGTDYMYVVKTSSVLG
ncbi:uncharacterized protein LOC134242855 [Saccostrea cucullata]|uniref:uncharacterized protein LOC134242855 n=1 Tax=Saccostrea cuccullata TaxID=36930 RepID=UPI002ED040EE